ncbi:MAG: hypothetical protein HY928_03870 [Elusimicrobia bacterium]|nr:hypothetical protein [Elusimicrobiota bacterium]
MSKKKKRQLEAAQKTTGGDVPAPAPSDGGESLSSTGLKTMAAGVVLAAAGFLVLTRADSMGRNWAATLSPFLILGGYAVVGWGIFRDDPAAPPPSQP